MPNLLVYGETNNGKTELLKHFCALHAPNLNPLVDNVKVPVLYTECCITPDEKAIYNFILDALGIYVKPRADVNQKKLQTFGALKAVECKVLIIDEIQHALTSSALRQRITMTTIKHISNTLQIPIILAGTQDALRVIRTEPQIENRFPAIELPRWKKDADYARLIASLIKNFSGGVNYSISKEFAIAVYEKSNGTIGMTSKIIEKCLENNPTELTPKLISDAILIRP